MEESKRNEGRGTTEEERDGKEEQESEREKDREFLKELRPMDDVFMRCMLRDNIPLVQYILRTITRIDGLEVTSCETQRDMNRLAGARSIVLDAHAEDSESRAYDLEIQRQSNGADPHRARYHSSVLDVENLRAGQDFKDLPETYTIFITEEDVFGKGMPVYHIERVNREMGDTPFGDGEHILYVNGSYRGNDPLGQLMHDFNCKDADEMYVDLMAEATRRLKENEKGVIEMGSVLDEMKEEYMGYGREEGMRQGIQKGIQQGMRKSSLETAKRLLLANRFTQEEVASYSGLSLDDVRELAK